MTQERGLTVRGNADLIESRESALSTLETHFALAVRQRELLEKYIRERLKPDKHFYTVGDDPGRKPSLTKEGAELICLPHVLKPRYSVLSGPDKPPSDNTPYQLTVLCGLYRNDIFEGEGIGSASSYITKKDGTYQPRQKDPGLCYNATIKMGQKSAYIAATLNSTAASEFFTQDLEDDQTSESKKQEQEKTEHWCKKHNTKFFKTEKMKAWAHPVKNPDGLPTLDDNGKPLWCSEKPQPEFKAQPATTTSEASKSTGIEEQGNGNLPAEPKEASKQAPKVDEQKFKRDPAALKTITDLQKALFEDFKLQPKQQLNELNIESWSQLAITPMKAYIQIASVRQDNF